jgi:beta-lactam-binding protein with PASTA domain
MTVPYVKPFDLQGMNLAGAEEALAQAGLKVGTTTHGVVDNCKPGSVIAVSPLAPTVLHAGDKVDLGLCG